MKFKFTFLLSACVFCAVINSCYAQDTASNPAVHAQGHPYIAWVSMFPEQKGNTVRKSTFKRIYEFLVRKNNRTNTLSRPVAIMAHDPVHFWVLDQGCQTMFQMEHDKLEIPRALRNKENYFTSLVDACSLPNGNILFTDSRLNKVFMIKDGDKRISELNDTLHFRQPTGIAFSPATNEIWVIETSAHRVSILDTNGRLIKRVGGRGDDNGLFNFPTSICIGPDGDAYIVDAMNFRVQIFNKDGAFVSVFGEAGDGSGSFARPKGIAIDTYGNIYVSDALFHVVQIFDRAGDFLYSFGKQGREQAEFWMPSGIYIDNKNYIYVADSYNSRVQIFQLINGG